jgi:DNA primase
MALITNRENTASALIALGYRVNRSWHFAAREDERTPSAYINDNGTIHDFGSGFHGDFADFLCEFRNMRKGDALREARRLLDLPIQIDFSSYEAPQQKKEGFIKEEWIKNFEKERKDNFPRFLELLNQALPALFLPQQREIAKRYSIGYSIQADRLIMPIRDEKGQCTTLWKYNKYPNSYVDQKTNETIKPSKVTFTSGRDRCPFNLQDLKKYAEDKNGWVLLCEGEKDTLNAIGRGYRAVTLGSASAKLSDDHLALFEGLKIVIVYDYDKAGSEGVYGRTTTHGEIIPGIKARLEQVAAEVKIWDWEMLALQEGFELFKGFDLTDWLCLKN